MVRRDNGEKIDINVNELFSTIPTLLSTIQSDMFNKAKAARDSKIVKVTSWEGFVPALESHCMVLTPFCDQMEWEEKVKVRAISLYVFFCNLVVSRKCQGRKC